MGQPPSRQNLRARSSWAISYRASLLAFLVLAALTSTQCDFSEIPDWKPVLALADAARRRGDLDHAKHLYLQAGKFAVWRDDWAGLLAAACGIKQLEREPYFSANALLLRAMVAAQKRQSQSGLVAVAKAFSTLGENKVASMVLSFVEDDRSKKPTTRLISLRRAVGTTKRKTVVEKTFTWARTKQSLIRENGFCKKRLMLGDRGIL